MEKRAKAEAKRQRRIKRKQMAEEDDPAGDPLSEDSLELDESKVDASETEN